MNKTFNIQDMQTYFKNYVPCHYHKKQPITNFCTQNLCSKYLCPQCVQQHSIKYSNHKVQSIKTCINKTRSRIQQTINILQDKTNKNNYLNPENAQEFTQKLIRQMEQVKKGLIQQIELYFRQKQAQIKRQTSKYSQTQKNISSLRQQLSQAIKQLKIFKKNLFETSKTVQTIQKANKIDYNLMIEHFSKKISKVQKQLKIPIKLQLNEQKKQQFRSSLNNIIQIKGKQKENKRRQEFNDSLLKIDKTKPNIRQSKRQYVLNPQPLSADRYFSKSSFLIEQDNYFKDGQPFLHFFQVSKANLHIVKIRDLQSNSAVKWQITALNINFEIPSFHKTICTRQGVIYLIGGTEQQTMKKSSLIYQYSPSLRTLKAVSKLQHSRSSHTLLLHNNLLYIIGGMGDNDILKHCQVYNFSLKSTQLISSSKYATVNSCVCSITDNTFLKLGGIFANGQNNQHIELYNIKENIWAEVDPVIQNIKGDFALLSCSGWAKINHNQVFVFGGYNQEANNQSSSSSFVIQCTCLSILDDQQQNQYSIKYINIKNLPLQQGFWSPQSIIHNNSIYALQNIDGEQGGDCLQDKRNVLIFDGKYWKTCLSQ